ncbi:MAG: glycoside hydrolase family 16 protein [Clostridia bacterium]|nr:glycoside hydrolase family 16 protein [Clostridia bacterium]
MEKNKRSIFPFLSGIRTNKFVYDDPNLLFEDTFDGTTLDDRKWKRSREEKRHGELCVWDDAMSFLDGKGHLVLRAEWDEKKKRVRSGAVQTSGRFYAGYGYYEASISFPTAPGTWGAFWQMCGNVAFGDGVEIDVIESIDNERGEASSALHWGGYGKGHKAANSGALKGYDLYDGNFHTFGLERTPEFYVFYVDGKETWRVLPDVFAPRPYGAFLWLSVEAADWAGAGKEESIKALPADMLVDYVRVYKTKPTFTQKQEKQI